MSSNVRKKLFDGVLGFALEFPVNKKKDREKMGINTKIHQGRQKASYFALTNG